MADIISRRSGVRREDAEARALIQRNRGTIEQLADTLSNGAYSASRKAKAAPVKEQPSGLIVSDLGAPRSVAQPKPYVRISLNRRVVVVDDATSRQMHFLGEIRRVDGKMRFVLATGANGFFTALADEIAVPLAALDGCVMGGARTDAALSAEIAGVLGFA